MKQVIMFAFCLMLSSTASANQWVYGKVKMLEDYGAFQNSKFEVLITLKEKRWIGDKEGKTNCTHRFKIKVGQQGITEDSKNRMFSMMLSAYIADKNVGLYVDENSGPYCSVEIGRIGDGF